MDQASSLRDKFKSLNQAASLPKITKSISITSGKGGVGKTSFSINFSFEMAQEGFKILLIDCDFGLANIDVVLNLRVKHTIEEVLNKKALMADAVIKFAPNLDVLPAASGIPEIADMDIEKQKYFIKEIAQIQDNYDFLVFDTGAGIHKSVLRINAAADHIIVITNSEPTAITDAYTIMKTLRNQYKIQSFNLVVNQCSPQQAENVKNLLASVAEENGVFYKLNLLGAIPNDKTVANAIFKRKLWSDLAPHSACTKALTAIARSLLKPEKNSAKADAVSRDKFRFWKKWFLQA